MRPQAKRAFKDALYDHFSAVARALANGHRLELLELIAQGEKTVETLANTCDLSVANTSQHLGVLKRAGLVQNRRAGTSIYYRVRPEAFALWQALRDFGEQYQPDIQTLLNAMRGNGHLSLGLDLETLQRKLATREITLLDVRPQDEFRAGHLPGALSIPLNDLPARLKELPEGEIVAYCRGPYCLFADQAVTLLRGAGFTAARFNLGVPDWQGAGLPVHTA